MDNDFGATYLDPNVIRACKVDIMPFDVEKTRANGNICNNNNAAFEYLSNGDWALVVRHNGGFSCAARGPSTGDFEMDLDAVYCALSIAGGPLNKG